MATNLAIDNKLLERAKRAGGLRTKKETVTLALEEFISSRQQRSEAVKRFLEDARKSKFRSSGPYPTRNDLHERS